jgi:NAD(P)-dependent dehydrogenase (short-subunit alcohol dehydrogenase family)
VARRAAAAGWTVCLSYVTNREAGEAVAAEIGGLAVRCDVAVEADIVELFRAADTLGPVTALVNNAGVVAERRRVDQMTADRVARMLAVNVVGPFLCAREAVRRMSTRHGGAGGAIVNVSSTSARLGSPGVWVDYAASKAALDTFTLGLAKEVAREGIRVNAVRPGYIATDIHGDSGDPDRLAQMVASIPMRRAGTVDEAAAAVVWLLGPGAGYCTGSVLDVSGGR